MTVAWYIDDALAGTSYSHPAIPYWNISVKLAFFVAVVHIMAKLKESLERDWRMERETYEREMAVAQSVQARLFPQILPEMNRFEYAAVCRPARRVSGDTYDVLALTPERLAIAVGDVSGKGLPAALLMASTQALLRSLGSLHGEAVDLVMRDLNRVLCSVTGPRSFVTLFYGVLDDAASKLTYVNAGHNAPMLARDTAGADGGRGDDPRLERLPSTGPVLGVFPGATWRIAAVSLRPRDRLLLFTDGIIEAMDRSDEEFGEERLMAVMTAAPESTAAELRDQAVVALDHFLGDVAPQDDVTIMAVRVRS